MSTQEDSRCQKHCHSMWSSEIRCIGLSKHLKTLMQQFRFKALRMWIEVYRSDNDLLLANLVAECVNAGVGNRDYCRLIICISEKQCHVVLRKIISAKMAELVCFSKCFVLIYTFFHINPAKKVQDRWMGILYCCVSYIVITLSRKFTQPLPLFLVSTHSFSSFFTEKTFFLLL